MPQHVELITIEDTILNEEGQLVRLSITAPTTVLGESLVLDMLNAIYGNLSETPASKQALLADLIMEISDPMPLADTALRLEGSAHNLSTITADILLTEGRLHPIWFPFEYPDPEEERAINGREWDRLVKNSVEYWLATKLPAAGIHTRILYVGENFYTAPAQTRTTT